MSLSKPPIAATKRLALLGSGDRRPSIVREVAGLRPIIEQFGTVVVEDFTHQLDLSDTEIDLVVVFGGDGSILRAARQMGAHQRPVLGVNLGRLGFLADVQPDELATALQSIRDGRCRVIDHLMLRCQIFAGERRFVDELGLNELAVLGGPPFEMRQIELYVDGILATTYSCDGLIISTPVGSTAHNLSAGGPILRKDLQAFVISALNPHTLTVRPVVDRADRRFAVIVPQPADRTYAVLDGREVGRLEPGHRVEVSRADSVFQLVEIEGHDYYGTLREKLGWSGDASRRRS
jgi:NAD+ kinase